VYYSDDYGRSWWQSTNDAAWTVRSDFASCAMPGTNRIMMCAGQVPNGANTECWTSTDGAGRDWTMQSSGQFVGFQSGTCVGLYDSTLFGGPNPNNTLVLIAPSGVVSVSHNYGITFSSGISTIPFVGTGSRNFLSAVADRSSNIYVLGGQAATDSNVYYRCVCLGVFACVCVCAPLRSAPLQFISHFAHTTYLILCTRDMPCVQPRRRLSVVPAAGCGGQREQLRHELRVHVVPGHVLHAGELDVADDAVLHA
jgi:hypothetical protein